MNPVANGTKVSNVATALVLGVRQIADYVVSRGSSITSPSDFRVVARVRPSLPSAHLSMVVVVSAVVLLGTVGGLSSSSSPSLTHGPPGTQPVTGLPAFQAVVTPQGSGWMAPGGTDSGSISLQWLESTDSCFGGYSIQYRNLGWPQAQWQGVSYGFGPQNQTSWWVPGVPSGVNEWELVDIPCSGSATYYYANFTQAGSPTLTCTVATSTSVACSWDNTARYGGLLKFYSYQLFEEHTPNGGGTSSFRLATITTEADTSYLVQGLTPGDTYGFYLNTTDDCSGSWVCTEYTQFGGAMSSSLAIVNPFVLPSGTSNTSAAPSSSLSGLGIGILVGIVVVAVSVVIVLASLKRRRKPHEPPEPPVGILGPGQ